MSESEPRTKAGRLLLGKNAPADESTYEWLRNDILAIEAEAWKDARTEGYWQGVHDGQHKSLSGDLEPAPDDWPYDRLPTPSEQLREAEITARITQVARVAACSDHDTIGRADEASVPPRSATPEPGQWWGVEHICEGIQRIYPTLHWADEPEHGAGPRRALHCDACGRRYAFHETNVALAEVDPKVIEDGYGPGEWRRQLG